MVYFFEYVNWSFYRMFSKKLSVLMFGYKTEETLQEPFCKVMQSCYYEEE